MAKRPPAAELYDRATRGFTSSLAKRTLSSEASLKATSQAKAGFTPQANTQLAAGYRADAARHLDNAQRFNGVLRRIEANPGRVNDLVRGQHNARVARATGLPAPVAKVAGAVARNPGKAGLAAAAITGAVALMTPSKAKADTPASDKKAIEPAMSPGEILSAVGHGAALHAGGQFIRDMSRDKDIAKSRAGQFAMRNTGRAIRAVGVGGIAYGLMGAIQGALSTYSKMKGGGSPEPAKDRTDPYTDRLGRNYAQGRKITRE